MIRPGRVAFTSMIALIAAFVARPHAEEAPAELAQLRAAYERDRESAGRNP